jgi:hypothetical protein
MVLNNYISSSPQDPSEELGQILLYNDTESWANCPSKVRKFTHIGVNGIKSGLGNIGTL